MAKRVEEIIVGVDVSKAWLDTYRMDREQSGQFENDAGAIEAWLAELAGPAALAVEATNDYHEVLVTAAMSWGHTVYLVDGYRLSRYREAVGERAKTDRQDARLLARYLHSERDRLRPVVVQSAEEKALWRLLKRRAKVVETRKQLRMSLTDVGGLDAQIEAVVEAMSGLIKTLERRIGQMARSLGWEEDLVRLRGIPGIGALSALGLRALYGRGEFARADQFIAFLGLDVRVRESGKYRGRRKLTKRGDPEIRRLLFNAARSAGYHDAHFAQLNERHRARGLSSTATSIVLARKLARIGYALLRDRSIYQNPERPASATMAA